MAIILRLGICFGAPVVKRETWEPLSACNSGMGITPPVSKYEELSHWQAHGSIDPGRRQAGKARSVGAGDFTSSSE
jgi:hypothetical protein